MTEFVDSIFIYSLIIIFACMVYCCLGSMQYTSLIAYLTLVLPQYFVRLIYEKWEDRVIDQLNKKEAIKKLAEYIASYASYGGFMYSILLITFLLFCERNNLVKLQVVLNPPYFSIEWIGAVTMLVLMLQYYSWLYFCVYRAVEIICVYRAVHRLLSNIPSHVSVIRNDSWHWLSSHVSDLCKVAMFILFVYLSSDTFKFRIIFDKRHFFTWEWCCATVIWLTVIIFVFR